VITLDHMAQKSLETVYRRNLETFGDVGQKSPKMLSAELNGEFC
jgi:hypothetical protein